MKTLTHAKSLQQSGILRTAEAEPGPRKDLLVLPDIPAVRQARKLFASNKNSAPFITTFGALAQRHNLRRPDRKQILSRTGRAVAMRKVAGDHFPGGMKNSSGAVDMERLGAELLRLNAGLKQSGIDARSIVKKAKRKLSPETFAKLEEIEPALTDFETLMKKAGMLDDTGAITELAEAIEKGKADGINGKVRRIIAAGFHSLTPSHLRIMAAAEKAGIQALLISAEPDGENEKTKVSLSSFSLMSDEAEFAASEIRTMIDGGRKIEDFAVIVRNLPSAGAAVADAFERNGVPVALQSGIRLGAASAIYVLLKDFLRAAEPDPGGKRFIRLLRNPMLKPFFSGADNVFEAVSEMESAFEKAGFHNEKDDALFETVTEQLRGEKKYEKALKKITELKEIISARFAADDGPMKMSDGFSGLAIAVDRTGANQNGFPRDRSLEEARETLREAAFLSEKLDCKAGSAEEFSRFANELLGARTYSYKTRSDGPCVPVMGALQTRGTSYPVVFVLDFSEQSFPLNPPVHMMLNNEEKEAINRCCGAQAFAGDPVHLSDEWLIWRSVSVCAEEELRISFSRNGAGTGGRRNLSHFIENSAVAEEKKGSNALISGQSIYSPEIARAAAFASEGKVPDELSELLCENDPFFLLADRVGAGVFAENERLRAEGEFCGFEGIVRETEERWWRKLRVSEIEKFGTCPFMFFCSKSLKIKENRESGEIPGASDTGSLYHAALKHLFNPETDTETWKIGREETNRRLSAFLDGEEAGNFRRRVSGEVWEIHKERVRSMVGRFVEFEKKRILEGKFTPEMVEKKVQFEIDGAEISGRFDRMDFTPQGGAYVVDYKKGSVKSKSFCNRANLQIPLYLAQISKELGIAPEGGAYLSVERPWEKNERTAAQDKDRILIETAMEFSRSNIELIKKGFFAPAPTDKPDGFPYERKTVLKKPDRPCGFCGYSDICRIKDGVTRTAKREKR